MTTTPREKQPDFTSFYGFADAATAFDQRHPQWRDALTRLHGVINLAFTRSHGVLANDIDKFVYFYGNLVAEDFMEIFLMAANGYGFGALKLLRSMYEHTVTLKYLHDNPDKLQAFFDYDAVQQRKLVTQIIDTFGTDSLSAETIAETEERYVEVKEQFMVKSCKSKMCSEQRVNNTWGIDLVSMAKKAGDIGSLIVHGYYVPMKHAHSTFRAMDERLEFGEGQVGFQRESPPEEADTALMTAHNCLLLALEIQKERFHIPGLEQSIQDSLRDWGLIWTPASLAELEADAPESASSSL